MYCNNIQLLHTPSLNSVNYYYPILCGQYSTWLLASGNIRQPASPMCVCILKGYSPPHNTCSGNHNTRTTRHLLVIDSLYMCCKYKVLCVLYIFIHNLQPSNQLMVCVYAHVRELPTSQYALVVTTILG